MEIPDIPSYILTSVAGLVGAALPVPQIGTNCARGPPSSTQEGANSLKEGSYALDPYQRA